jgi:hypothetical protein
MQMSDPVDPNASNEPTPPVEGQSQTPEPPKEPTPNEPPAFVPLAATDISMPEGFTVDEPLMNDFLAIVNNQELDGKERTNQLVGLYAKAQTAASEANSKAWETMQTEWQETVKADPTIGGANFEGTMTKVGKLMEEFGNDELRQVFDLTGAGNNVHVVRFLAGLADKLTEGSFTPGNPASAPQDTASKLFPSMKG